MNVLKAIRNIYYKNILRKYVLTDIEYMLWRNICRKACQGYAQWFSKTRGDDICGPWITNCTTEEMDLLNKIYHYLYKDDLWVALPLSTAQINYMMYEDIKDKVIYESKR